jgi:hypothetical protein
VRSRPGEPVLRRAAPLVSALAAVALTGCGGSSDTLSMRALRSRATYLCSNANHLTQAIKTPTSPGAAGPFLDQGIAVLGPELTALRTLRPPSDVADVYSTAIAALSQEVQLLGHVAERVHAGADPVIEMKGLERRLAPLENQADGAWQALQIPACLSQ